MFDHFLSIIISLTLAKHLKNIHSQNGPSAQEIIGNNGNCLRTDKEKGGAFPQRYKSQLQENAEEQLRTKWDEINSKIPKNTIWDYEPKVTDAELRNVIKSITKDTTSGPNKVVHPDLKILAESKEMFNDLLKVVNATLKEGTISFDWRDCNLSVLPKPNKGHRILKQTNYAKRSPPRE